MDELNNLDALAASTDAAILDSQPVDPNAPPPPAPEPTRQEQAGDLVNMFAGLVTSYAPDTLAIWTPEAKANSAAVIAPLLEKYNVSLINLPPELMAAVVVGPLLWQSSKIVAAKIARDRNPQPRENPDGQPVPEAEVAPGAPVHSQMGLYTA